MCTPREPPRHWVTRPHQLHHPKSLRVRWLGGIIPCRLRGKGIPHLPLATLKAEAVSLCFLRSVPSTSVCDTVLSLTHPYTLGLCLGGDGVCSSPCSWLGPTSSLFLPSKKFFVFVLFSRVRKTSLSGSCRAPHLVCYPSPAPFCSCCSGCLSWSSELPRQ